MIACYMVGAIMGVLGFIFRPDLVFLKKEAVKTFLVIISLAFFALIALWSIAPEEAIRERVEQVTQFPLWSLALVGWEDAVFTLPCAMAQKRAQEAKAWWSKALFTIPALLVAGLFGTGHAYQGESRILVTAIIMFFVMAPLGRKHGIITVAICHVLFDFAVVLAPLFAFVLK